MRNGLQVYSRRELGKLFEFLTDYPSVTALTVQGDEVTRLDVSAALCEAGHGAEFAGSLAWWCRWTPAVEVAACLEDIVRTHNSKAAMRAGAARREAEAARLVVARSRMLDASERAARLDAAERRIAAALDTLDATRAAGGAYRGDLGDVLRNLDATADLDAARRDIVEDR